MTVTVDGKTLAKYKDYEVTYGDNMNAGKNAGTVTITAKGNYDFAQIVKMFDITAQIIQVTAENKSSAWGRTLLNDLYARRWTAFLRRRHLLRQAGNDCGQG